MGHKSGLGIGIAACATVAQVGIALGPRDARADVEAALAPQRAAPTCRFKKGAWPSQTLGEDVTRARNKRTGRWLRPTEIPVEKIVVLMQENRSFDHYFGRLPDYLRRKLPNHPGARPGGIDVPPPDAHNPVDIANPNGQKVRWHRATKLCHSDTNHEWWGSHFQWNGGKMNGFFQSNHGFFEKNEPIVPRSELGGERAMQFYDDRELPFYYKLAATFAIGDRYFSSLIGPTWPNRDFLYGATSRGMTYNSAVETKADLALDLKKSPAILFDQLTIANIPWRIYIDGGVLTSRIARIGSFTGPLGLARRLFPSLEAHAKAVWTWIQGLPQRVAGWAKTLWGYIGSMSLKAAYDFLAARVAEAMKWLDGLARSATGTLARNAHIARVMTALQGLKAAWDGWKILSLNALSGAKNVYNAVIAVQNAVIAAAWAADAALRGPTATIKRFLEDARTGQLPPVSFIDTNVREDVNSTDEHPPADVQIGQEFTWRIVQALMSGPDWKKTALFITYDEHGGFYDHAPPPAACPPDDFTGNPDRFTTAHPGNGGVKFGGHGAPLDVKFRGAFHRYGIRVPLIVVSPWVKRGYVSRRVYDHTSILRFIQARFNLPALSHRDANADAMFDLFDFTNHDRPSLAPSAGVRPSDFSRPPIDAAGLALCRRTFPPAAGSESVGLLRKAMPNSIAERPFPEGSLAYDMKKVQRVCSSLQPGVCAWGRTLPGPPPPARPHHALPVLGGE
jgi:phospholipase C